MWMMFVSLRNKKTLIFTSYFSKIFFMKFATILIKCSRILWQILETVQRSQISDKRKKKIVHFANFVSHTLTSIVVFNLLSISKVTLPVRRECFYLRRLFASSTPETNRLHNWKQQRQSSQKKRQWAIKTYDSICLHKWL